MVKVEKIATHSPWDFEVVTVVGFRYKDESQNMLGGKESHLNPFHPEMQSLKSDKPGDIALGTPPPENSPQTLFNPKLHSLPYRSTTVLLKNCWKVMQHGGNTPHGGNGHVTHSRPTYGLGIGLLMYLRSILLHR